MHDIIMITYIILTGKFVAMLKESSGDFSLVVTDFTTQFNNILKFDFQMDVPGICF